MFFFQRNVAFYYATNSVFLFIRNRPTMAAIGSRILITSVASALNLYVTSLSSCPVFVTRRLFAVGRVSFATDTLLK